VAGFALPSASQSGWYVISELLAPSTVSILQRTTTAKNISIYAFIHVVEGPRCSVYLGFFFTAFLCNQEKRVMLFLIAPITIFRTKKRSDVMLFHLENLLLLEDGTHTKPGYKAVSFITPFVVGLRIYNFHTSCRMCENPFQTTSYIWPYPPLRLVFHRTLDILLTRQILLLSFSPLISTFFSP